MQEISPSGENGSVVTIGDYVRDVFLEQVLVHQLLQLTCELVLLPEPLLAFAYGACCSLEK